MRSMKTNCNKKITIYDIAAEAGVSASTVSRVMTNSANVDEKKKQKVLSAIEKYNFKPNTFAKGLVNAKSHTIGILMADVRNPYYASMFVACEWAARKENYSVSLYNFLNDKELEKQLLERLLERGMDAIILLGGHEDELNTDMGYAELINNIMTQIPVIITGKLDGTDCDIVRINHMKSMDLIMEHLLLLGHEKIAVLGGRMNVLSTFEKVIRYKQFLRTRRIPYNPNLIGQNGTYDINSGYTQMNELYEKNIIPTAVIAVNDYAALGIMQCIHKHGQKIPEDISIVSYDNTYISEITVPNLTSISYNYEEYGSLLIQTAIRRINGASVEKMQILEPELIIRGSSYKAPAKKE